MAVTMTAPGVAKIKPAATPIYIVDTSGLVLRVGPAATGGKKSWSMRYRIGRYQRRITFGEYPSLSLADARKRARDAKKQVDDGKDPAELKEQRRDADTVETFAETYIEHYAKKNKRTWKTDQSYLDTKILPKWKHRLMRDITRRDIGQLLDAIDSKVVGNRVRALISKMFTFAIEDEVYGIGGIEHNPVQRVKKPLKKEIPRDRTLTNDEIITLWSACDSMRTDMAALYRLLLITAQRTNEIRKMRWNEIDGNWWTIPGERSKNGKSHRVYLTQMSLDILATLPKDGEYVLRGTWNKKQESKIHKTIPIPNFRKYPDLKTTAASRMAGELGIAEADIGKVLNHTAQSVTAKHYIRASFDSVKQSALTAWSRHLTAILENKESNVLTFTTRS